MLTEGRLEMARLRTIKARFTPVPAPQRIARRRTSTQIKSATGVVVVIKLVVNKPEANYRVTHNATATPRVAEVIINTADFCVDTATRRDIQGAPIKTRIPSGIWSRLYGLLTQ